MDSRFVRSKWRVLAAAAAAAVLGVAMARGGDDGARPATKLDWNGGATGYVRVTDLDRSIRWYHEKLGFELIFKVDAIGWCELKSPLEKLSIGLLKSEKVEAGGGATLVFGVKDADAARKSLEAAGVKMQGPTIVHEGYVKLVPFLDLDGNLFTLSQSLEVPAAAGRPEGGVR
jgi:predicted enzyme related to lactoylglutathione lyase